MALLRNFGFIICVGLLAGCQTTDRSQYMGGTPREKLNDRVSYTSNIVDGTAYIRATYTEYSFTPPNLQSFRHDCLQIAFKTAEDISASQNDLLEIVDRSEVSVEARRDGFRGHNICEMRFAMQPVTGKQ